MANAEWHIAAWLTLILAAWFQYAAWFLLDKPFEPFALLLISVSAICFTVIARRTRGPRRHRDVPPDES
jgi:hypothetical protein